MDFYSHTHTHPRLTEEDETRLTDELVVSKHELEGLLQRDVWAVSYPFGDFDKRVCACARKARYRYGFTIEPISVDESPDPFQVGRVEVTPGESPLGFRLKIQGCYSAIRYLRNAKRILAR